MLLQWSLPVGVFALAAGLAVGFQFPVIWLYNIATKRDAEMQRGLADAIDLLTISVEAGLGFDAALQQVAKNTEGPLAGELSRVLQEMQIGRSRSEALRAMGDRTKLMDVRSFVSSMVQADAFGIPIGQVLRVQSQEIRVKRRQRAEEKAGQVPVKIMIPVVLFILPCLLLVVMGPAIISVAGSF
jgi:tight adherence protein C